MNKFDKITKELLSVFGAILIALCIRTVVFEPFTIPSPSMYPGLIEGDYIIVNKLGYGISRHSILFSPKLFSGRFFQVKELQRGDITVFKNPQNESEYWIKRLIGLPGDRIQMKNGRLYINGAIVQSLPQGDYVFKNTGHKAELILETLQSGRSYLTINDYDHSRGDNTEQLTVPENHYFFMGDNRDNSNDSRLDLGFVHQDHAIGKAEYILFSNEFSILNFFNWLTGFRKDRFIRSLYNNSFATH
jgi:signal peptidase I